MLSSAKAKHHLAFNTCERCLNLNRIKSKQNASVPPGSKASSIRLSSQAEFKFFATVFVGSVAYFDNCSFVTIVHCRGFSPAKLIIHLKSDLLLPVIFVSVILNCFLSMQKDTWCIRSTQWKCLTWVKYIHRKTTFLCMIVEKNGPWRRQE